MMVSARFTHNCIAPYRCPGRRRTADGSAASLVNEQRGDQNGGDSPLRIHSRPVRLSQLTTFAA